MTKKSNYRGIPDNPALHDSKEFSFFESMKEVLETIVGHRPNVAKKKWMATLGDLNPLKTKQVQAEDVQGLKLTDDGGNGILVEDGGAVKLNNGFGDATQADLSSTKGDFVGQIRMNDGTAGSVGPYWWDGTDWNKLDDWTSTITP